MERVLNRRQALFTIGVSVATGSVVRALLDPPAAAAPPNDDIYINEIFGLHGPPVKGGGLNHDQLIDDLNTLNAKWVTLLDPDEDVIERVLESGINLITRVPFTDNIYNEDWLVEVMKKLTKFIKKPIVIPFNEVNLESETGGIPRPPRQHVEEFYSATEVISSYNGLSLITPMSQDALTEIEGKKLSDIEYLNEYTWHLKEKTPRDWAEKKIATASHIYTQVAFPGRDVSPIPRIGMINAILLKNLGFIPDHYITEGGIGQNVTWPYGDRYMAQESIKLMDLFMPGHLKVKCYNFWVLANQAQRSKIERWTPDLRKFELASWRAPEGPKKIYLDVADYMNNKNPGSG